ncbi:MAG: tetratricopeptide repeat protein [Nitrospirae bacterium]|nr:tetratricopeptide repeat protein [Nitrospirota bacterium]
MIRLFRKTHIIPALIFLVGFLAYANTFTVPFQFDDDAYIVNNPIIRTFHYFFAPSEVTGLTERTPTAVPPALRYAFMTRMLGYFTFAVNYHLHGLDVIGYHAVNLAIHLLNGMFVFLILRTTLKRVRFTDAAAERIKHEDFFAGSIALLFVSHPIQTQAVTYISQRFASLAAFFYLLSFLLYLRSCLSSAGRWRTAAYGGALVSAVAAMLTKEFTITLPLMLALYDITFLPGSMRDRIRRLAPFAATLAIIPALVFIQQGTLHDLDSTMRTITAADSSNIPRGHYLLTQFRVVALYLRLLFIPLGQNIDHDVPVYTSLFAPAVLFSFLLLLLLIAAALWLYVVSKRKPGHPELMLAAFGILWFFITLSVESSIIPLGELAAEYRLYLPSIGISMAVVSLGHYAAKMFSLRPSFLYGACALVVIALSTASSLRNTVWASETALWEDAARKSPARVRPHQNLGTYYGTQGRLEDAKRELLAALALAPADFELHNNLGVIYKRMGLFDEAEREYTIVLKLSPGDVMARYNLGNVYLAQGKVPEAIREYELTVKLIPDYDEAHNNLGIAYQKSGQFDAAIREFNRALQLNPQNEHVRRNLEAAVRKLSLPH